MKTLKKILSKLLFPLLWLRGQFIKYLIKLRARLHISSLRTAIVDADKDKDRTGRKNIVVFNSHNGVFEPIQKKQLKAIANSRKNTSNKAMTPGRRKMMQKRKARIVDQEQIKTIEKKSLYVTN